MKEIEKIKKIICVLLVICIVFGLCSNTVQAEKKEIPFSDVYEQNWYYDSVKYVYDKGLMTGSGGRFNPLDNVTRAQLVTTLYRLAGSPHVTDYSGFADFEDIELAKYYTEAVCWAYTNGITTGINGKFDPTGKLTRQQLATFLFRYAEFAGLDTDIRGDYSQMINADKVSAYATDAVEWTVGAGLISGSEVIDENGEKAYDLKPRGYTTRSQLATFLMRFCENCGSNQDEKRYTVTFDSNGGSKIESQQVNSGGFLINPEIPTKTDCMFVGWYFDEKLTQHADIDTLTVTKDMILYAQWINIAEKNDCDKDGISDDLERFLGINPEKNDTDNDGLDDIIEIDKLSLDPTLKDTDKNGINDGDEDNDGDGLINLEEIRYNTDPSDADSDDDTLNDYDETQVYNTDPLNSDSDGDGVSDGKEIELGTNPLNKEVSFKVSQNATSEDNVNASVEVELSGEQVETLEINVVNNPILFSNEMAGYIGNAYDFSVEGEFESAQISFEFDEALLDSKGFNPVIYYFNQDTQMLEELETIIEGSTASTTVTHFSTYILLNKIEYDKIWDTEIKPPEYESDPDSVLDIAFVIDYSLSMEENDPNQLFKTLSKEFVAKLRDGKDQAAIVKFIKKATLLQGLTTDKEALNTAIDSIRYDNGYGINSGTDGSIGIKKALDELAPSESKYKYIVFITDGADNGYSYSYDSLISTAKYEGVIIYTVGMGTASEGVLTKIANGTEGKYYHATTSAEADDILNLEEVFDIIRSETIDYKTDSNNDGISDYFTKLLCEGRLVTGSGVKLFDDFSFEEVQANADYDKDGLLNGEEVTVTVDEENGKVYLKVISSPIKVDSDDDGLYDNAVRTGYKTSSRGVEKYVVAPKDPEPLQYTGPVGMWKTHIAEQQNASNVAGSYADNTHGIDFDLPEEIEDFIINAALQLQSVVKAGGTVEKTAEDIIRAACLTIKRFCEFEVQAIAGAYLLNFVPDNLDVAYHSQPDTWQRDYGYNDFYDTVFRVGSFMEYEPVKFAVDETEYVVWMWKGDYWNLQTGAEIGLYIYDHTSSGELHYNVVDFELPMTLSLYNYNTPNNIDNVFNWAPETKQWWITGFNTDYKNPEPEKMVSVGSIDFKDKPEIYEALKNAVIDSNYSEYFVFNENDYIAWIMWR